MSALETSARERDDMIADDQTDGSTLDGALDSLDTGVLVLNHELRVTYSNARWTAWRGVAIPTGVPLATLVELAAGESLLELKATLADGEPRTLHFVLRPAHADSASRYVVSTVKRVGLGLVLEARAETDAELLPLYDVALAPFGSVRTQVSAA